MFGPDDLNAGVYGLDFVASKDVGALAPYAGVSGFLSWGREHTSKVDLDNETVPGLQAMVGVTARLSALRLGAEFSLARVNAYSFKIAFGR